MLQLLLQTTELCREMKISKWGPHLMTDSHKQAHTKDSSLEKISD